MSAKPNLRSVPQALIEEPAPDMSYEHQERRRIASKDWAAIHVRGDRGVTLNIIDRITRPWR